MMLIHRVNEGDYLHYGINWMNDENTFFRIHLVLPVMLISPREYKDLFSMNIFYGWRIKKIFLRFCIRRWTKFPKNVRKILWSASTGLCGIGEQNLICTYEQKFTGY